MQETWVPFLVWDNPTRGPRVQESQLLSLCATTNEAHAPQSPCCTTGEGTAVRSPHTTAREQPPLAKTREKPAQQWTPSTPEINEFFKKKSLVKDITLTVYTTLMKKISKWTHSSVWKSENLKKKLKKERVKIEQPYDNIRFLTGWF